MAQTTKRGYTDNLRYFRRWLQGRGVNIRETLVTVDAYADVRIVVPGLHDDDKVISVLNMTDLVDVTGDLDDGATAASRVIQNLTFTALAKGLEGNKIGVAAWQGLSAYNATDRISAPLSVKFSGETITVYLATDGSGVALTDGSNSATKVRNAILAEQEALHGDAWVDVTGSSGTDWTIFTVLLLSGGTAFKQGPSFASLVTGFTSPYDTGNVRYTAVQAGAEGNDITIEYAAGGALAVAVVDDAITVTYVVGVTTAKDVIDAVNADADAKQLVLASPVRYGTGSAGSADEGDTAGFIETLAPTNLSGGVDPGIQLSVPSDTPLASKTLKVMWVTRDQRDEDTRA